MARFDFWNNPLVVSAFRLKGRKQFPLAAYVLILIAIGGVLEYLSRNDARPWQASWSQIHLVVVVALTAGASFLFAMIATQASIASEVSNKTLDFQRITGLSPAEVVVGKIFGEPALAYLLIPASFPVALFGVLRSETLGIGQLVVAYVPLFTFAVLGGAAGLLHPLEQTNNKPGGGAAAGWAILFLIAAPYLVGGGFLVSKSPTAAFLLGSFTPAPIVVGLFEGNVWNYKLHLYELSIPYVIYTPIAQLSLAFLLFSIMARRLKNPLETPLPKPAAYLALAAADVVLVGFFLGEDPLQKFGGVGYNVAGFAFAHLALSVLLTFCVTPTREGIDSWMWGLRRVRHDWREWLFGNRSPNVAAVFVTALLGGIAVCGLLAWSGGIAEGLNETNHLGPVEAPFPNWVGVAAVLTLIIAFGFALQAAALAMKRMTAFIVLAMVFGIWSMVLAGVGSKFEWPLAVSLSPFGQFLAWTDPREFQNVTVSPWPYFLAMAAVAALSLGVTLRYLRGFRTIVAAKLRSMGLVGAS